MPTWTQWFVMFGGSTLMALIVTFIFNAITNNQKKKRQQAQMIAEEVTKKDEVLKRGVQALLRHELYSMYDYWYTQMKYAPIEVKNDFENIYGSYHNLGKNGVMDGMHERFMELPEEPKTKKQLREG